MNYPKFAKGLNLGDTGRDMARGKHKSATSDLDWSLRWLESLESGTNGVLERTENCRHSYPPGHLRYKQETKGGLKLNGYSGNGVIDVFVRCDNNAKEETVKKIKDRFHKVKKK